jgi:heme/copper-type cytochrome/quinol oxidase subunit 2
MIRDIFVAMFILLGSMIGYYVGHKPMTLLLEQARDSNAPNWLIDSIWWAWNHWIYIMVFGVFLFLIVATQRREYEEYYYE